MNKESFLKILTSIKQKDLCNTNYDKISINDMICHSYLINKDNYSNLSNYGIDSRYVIHNPAHMVRPVEAVRPAAADKVEASKVEAKAEVKTDNEIVCVICLDSVPNVLFLPCRHLKCCSTCSVSTDNCPVCRAKIVDKIKAFI